MPINKVNLFVNKRSRRPGKPKLESKCPDKSYHPAAFIETGNKKELNLDPALKLVIKHC